jgi:hypothetical protein
VKRRHRNCIIGDELSTGYPQVDDPAFDPSVDIMDVPDLFSGEDDPENAPRRNQAVRSKRAAAPTGSVPHPRVKDQTVNLPADPVMRDAMFVADWRRDVVTSGDEGDPSDGVHDPSSQHYQGTAIDVRYAARRGAQVADYRAAGYIVVPEADHLHVQKYPRRV